MDNGESAVSVPPAVSKPGTTARAVANEVLKGCHQVLVAAIRKLFAQIIKQFEDQLFDQADKAGNDEQRAALFNAGRTVKTEREALEQQLLARFSAKFNDALRPSSGPAGSGAKGGGSLDGLSLVGVDELEESLVIDNLITSIYDRFPEELYALEHRLAHLSPRAGITKETNPLGPRPLCEAFRELVQELQIDPKLKLLICKLFRDALLAEIEGVLGACNAYLIKARVLPDLKRVVAKPQAAPTRAPVKSTAEKQGNNAPAVEQSHSQAVAPIDPNMFKALQQLLGGQTGNGATSGAVGSANAAYIPVTPQLLDTLTALQEDQEILSRAGSLTKGGFKNEILSEFGRHRKEGGQRVINQLDQETIDVISMIFDYILDDRNLPDFVKALIGRLQIPVLKLAIVDRDFFSRKGHPARQLLNELAQAGLGWADETEASRDRLYEKMDTIVKRVLNEFDSNTDVFQTLLDDLRAFLAEEKERFEVEQAKLSAAAQAADRIEQLKKGIAEEIANVLLEHTVPDDVRAFLTGPWREVLTDITLNEGVESLSAIRGRDFISELVWSVEPKTSTEDRKKLIELLPRILKILQKGLRRIDYSPTQLADVAKMLEKYHLESIKGEGKGGQPVARRRPARAGVSSEVDELGKMLEDMKAEIRGDASQEGDHAENVAGAEDSLEFNLPVVEFGSFEDMMAEMGFEMAKDDAPRVDDEFTDRVRALEPGTWVEFIAPDGKKQRGKLAWKGDELSGYTFVNRRFKVVAEKPLYVLAEDFRQGSVSLIEDVALFDRALDGVISGIAKVAG